MFRITAHFFTAGYVFKVNVATKFIKYNDNVKTFDIYLLIKLMPC